MDKPKAETNKFEWKYHAWQMANRHHRPRVMRYEPEPCEDTRLKYMLYFLDVRGLRVLELGPLEGHHSIMLEKMGVKRTVAVEGRAVNMDKCRHVKQTFKLKRTTFVQKNLEDLYLGKESLPTKYVFDLVFCCGVLYHLPDPFQALRWCRKQAPALFLGTIYCKPGDDGALLNGYRGYWHAEFGGAPQAGMSNESFWPTDVELIRMVKGAGYRRVDVLGYDLQNDLPHITLMAHTGGGTYETPDNLASA